jgi:hypothetical protein
MGQAILSLLLRQSGQSRETTAKARQLGAAEAWQTTRQTAETGHTPTRCSKSRRFRLLLQGLELPGIDIREIGHAATHAA